MKFTRSGDGIERTSIRVIMRLDRNEIKVVREFLKKQGEPHTDAAVREFVGSLTEYHELSSFREADGEEDDDRLRYR